MSEELFKEAAQLSRARADFDVWIADIRKANAELRTAVIDSMIFRGDAAGLRKLANDCRECGGGGWVVVLNDYGDGVESDECHGCRELWGAIHSLERDTPSYGHPTSMRIRGGADGGEGLADAGDVRELPLPHRR